ncbi:MAG TPA: ABC transporter ATP-binding protein [Candidatus Hydrogenedentes bacterium]|nr:ABC transporter ATP-binding protein [Candidatus Hydrogenedentota bacterium]HQH66966.1 ABC transporter ATP-binding protein [Candidatus Hydrogenedentota bacterium]HQM48603.1 ABC transporter ATP-binding protein [Candidatus Hydrogenedentota bacterium]
MTLLEVQDVSLRLDGKQVLGGVSAGFKPGKVYAIVGPNGAGKSTLANVIMGLPGYTGFEGDIVYRGQSLKGVPVDERARRGMTLAWQEPARFEGLSVHRFVTAGAKTSNGRDLAASALRQVGLDPARYLNRAVDKTLSGGERKRIELASILAIEPALVLMDEPDSGIDVEALDQMFQAIHTLKEKGSTVILITHSRVVLRQAENAYLLCDGRVIEEGPVKRIGQYFENRCVQCDHANEPDPREAP